MNVLLERIIFFSRGITVYNSPPPHTRYFIFLYSMYISNQNISIISINQQLMCTI